MAFSIRQQGIATILLLILALALTIFLFLPRFRQPKSITPPIPATTPTPSASPSATPTPKPLSFAEMNALYGPCVNLPVLMYHHIQDKESAQTNGNSSLTVYPEIFAAQLAYLQTKGYQSITPADLIAFFDTKTPLPKKSVLLTFDDGYADFATTAVPLLSQAGFKAILFIPTGLMDNPGYLSWSTIKGFSSDIYIANHTWSHQNMSVGLDTIKQEVDTAANQLSEKDLDPLKIFAYPYGTISQRATSFLRDAGFQLAFTTVSGRTLCAKQRLGLPRLRIGNTSLSAYGL